MNEHTHTQEKPPTQPNPTQPNPTTPAQPNPTQSSPTPHHPPTHPYLPLIALLIQSTATRPAKMPTAKGRFGMGRLAPLASIGCDRQASCPRKENDGMLCVRVSVWWVGGWVGWWVGVVVAMMHDVGW